MVNNVNNPWGSFTTDLGAFDTIVSAADTAIKDINTPGESYTNFMQAWLALYNDGSSVPSSIASNEGFQQLQASISNLVNEAGLDYAPFFQGQQQGSNMTQPNGDPVSGTIPCGSSPYPPTGPIFPSSDGPQFSDLMVDALLNGTGKSSPYTDPKTGITYVCVCDTNAQPPTYSFQVTGTLQSLAAVLTVQSINSSGSQAMQNFVNTWG